MRYDVDRLLADVTAGRSAQALLDSGPTAGAVAVFPQRCWVVPSKGSWTGTMVDGQAFVPCTWRVVDASTADVHADLSATNVLLVSDWVVVECASRLHRPRRVNVTATRGPARIGAVPARTSEWGEPVMVPTSRRPQALLRQLVDDGVAARWKLWEFAAQERIKTALAAQVQRTVAHVSHHLDSPVSLSPADADQIVGFVTTGTDATYGTDPDGSALFRAIDRHTVPGQAPPATSYIHHATRTMIAAARDETLRRLGVPARAMSPGASDEARDRARLTTLSRSSLVVETPDTALDETQRHVDGEDLNAAVAAFLADSDRVEAVLEAVRCGARHDDAALLAVAVDAATDSDTKGLARDPRRYARRLLHGFMRKHSVELGEPDRLAQQARALLSDPQRFAAALAAIDAGQTPSGDARVLLWALHVTATRLRSVFDVAYRDALATVAKRGSVGWPLAAAG